MRVVSENNPGVCPLAVQCPSTHRGQPVAVFSGPRRARACSKLRGLKALVHLGASYVTSGITAGGSQFHCRTRALALSHHRDQSLSLNLGDLRPGLHPEKGFWADYLVAISLGGHYCGRMARTPMILLHIQGSHDSEKLSDLPRVVQSAAGKGARIPALAHTPELGGFPARPLGDSLCLLAQSHLPPPTSSLHRTQRLVSGCLAGTPAPTWLRIPSCLLD